MFYIGAVVLLFSPFVTGKINLDAVNIAAEMVKYVQNFYNEGHIHAVSHLFHPNATMIWLRSNGFKSSLGGRKSKSS